MMYIGVVKLDGGPCQRQSWTDVSEMVKGCVAEVFDVSFSDQTRVKSNTLQTSSECEEW